jgi:hypothetical protein
MAVVRVHGAAVINTFTGYSESRLKRVADEMIDTILALLMA